MPNGGTVLKVGSQIFAFSKLHLLHAPSAKRTKEAPQCSTAPCAPHEQIVKLQLPSQRIDAKQCKQLTAFGELRHRHTKYWCKHLALNQHQCSTIQNEYHLQLIWPTTDQNDVHPAKRPYLYTSLDKRNHRLASKALTTKESYIQNNVLPELQINRFWGPDLKLWRSIVQQLHHHEKWEHHAHQDGAPVLENHTLWMMDLLYRVVALRLRKTTNLPMVTYPIEYCNQNLKYYSIAHYWVWVPCFYYIQRLQYIYIV